MSTPAAACGGARALASLTPLFDPARPPGELDAVDLVFDVPASAGLLHTVAVLDGPAVCVAAVAAAQEAGAAAVVDRLCSHALLAVGEHGPRPAGHVGTVGEYRYGVLALTRVRHEWAVDRSGTVHTEVARLHEHVYLGVTGVDPRTSRSWPVALDAFAPASGTFAGLHAVFSHIFRTALAARLPVVWSVPPTPGAEPELTAPPMAEHLAGHRPVSCHDGPRVRQRWHVRALARPCRRGGVC